MKISVIRYDYLPASGKQYDVRFTEGAFHRYVELTTAELRELHEATGVALRGETAQPMTLSQAVQIVVTDQRQSYPEMTVREAVEHAAGSIDLRRVIDSFDSDDSSSEAYLLLVTTWIDNRVSDVDAAISEVELRESEAPK